MFLQSPGSPLFWWTIFSTPFSFLILDNAIVCFFLPLFLLQHQLHRSLVRLCQRRYLRHFPLQWLCEFVFYPCLLVEYILLQGSLQRPLKKQKSSREERNMNIDVYVTANYNFPLRCHLLKSGKKETISREGEHGAFNCHPKIS